MRLVYGDGFAKNKAIKGYLERKLGAVLGHFKDVLSAVHISLRVESGHRATSDSKVLRMVMRSTRRNHALEQTADDAYKAVDLLVDRLADLAVSLKSILRCKKRGKVPAKRLHRDCLAQQDNATVSGGVKLATT